MTVKDTAARAGDALNQTYRSTLDRAGGAYSSVRGAASSARQATAERIDTNPIAALIGGLALGVVIGSLLPRTRQEDEAIGPYGRALTQRAREAAEAARAAGAEKLDELGFNKDQIKENAQQFVDTARNAVSEAGGAAAKAVKEGGASGSNPVQGAGTNSPSSY